MPGIVMFAAGVIALAGIYAILALALNLQFGFGGLINFGVVAFFAVGAYAYTILSFPPPTTADGYMIGLSLPWWISFPAAGLIAALFAWLLGLPTLRVQGEYLLIVTFGFAEVVKNSLKNETWLSNGVKGFYSVPQPFRESMDGQSYQVLLAVMVLVVLAVCYLIVNAISTAPFGRTLRAVRESEEVALSAGKNAFSFKLRAFVLSAAICGIAGAMYVWYMTIAIPGIFAAEVTFAAWIALVIGGTGNNKGAILGAFVLLCAQQAVRFVNADANTAQYITSVQIGLEGLLLVVILRLRPKGLLAERSPHPWMAKAGAKPLRAAEKA